MERWLSTALFKCLQLSGESMAFKVSYDFYKLIPIKSQSQPGQLSSWPKTDTSRKFTFVSVNYRIRCDIHHQYAPVPSNGLQQHPSRSRSVPEGLAHVSSHGCECHLNRRSNRWKSSSFRHHSRPVQVVEQITTSV